MKELYSTPATSPTNITRNEWKHVIVSGGEYAGVMPASNLGKWGERRERVREVGGSCPNGSRGMHASPE